ncbi:MAG: hypothetical protein Q8N35_17720 [Methylococcaceae bacterium]|nr:hypothetical protein [Methylococcaceae bacterium]MDZ4155177.1 hypothetical protein [Methylococcales bacterium]MDP2394379.1 hypothetical protein [Methylococcaceae bacterium]MDP3021422.1 hypothetical protein [Methylococcaceae bacterium]MDP3388604.1 hypothetical protein [Methylococcaceae bacterium]
MEKRCLRFQDISVSEKMLYSLFLMTIGIGYLFALTHMYYTHQMRDGEPGMSIQDVMIAYYGSQDQTRLGSAINGGPMEPNLKSANDKEKILVWLSTGKSKAAFEQDIAPILNRDCTLCHNGETNPGLPNLTNYEGVMEVASSKAASIPGLVKVSHIHLFGIAFILLFVGRIFIYCRMNVTLKRIIVVIPFLSMLIDTLSWFITRNNPSFAYVVVASGALMGLSMGAQIIISLYQMWVETFHPKLWLSASQQQLLKKIVISFEQIASPIVSSSKACVLKFAPIIWLQLRVAAVQVSLSLYHIVRYQLHPKLNLSVNNQLKAQQYKQTLTESGYSVWFVGNGWLVKESVLTWLFFNSIDALEHYIQHLPYQASASTEPSEYKV